VGTEVEEAMSGSAVLDQAPPILTPAPPIGGVTPSIEVHELEKRYAEVRAVDGISFAVAAREVFGLLGHNGASKTTTIRTLTGRTLPTAGTAEIANFDVVADRESVKPLINLVFEGQDLYERFSGRDNLRIFADAWLSYLVMAAWRAVAYLIVVRQLKRWQA
jgi:ABC-2 type transport system ATP-binding protein